VPGDTAQFVRYLLAGAVAAAANYGSRFLFNRWMSFEIAVAAAFFIGLLVGFCLMRAYAFGARSTPSVARQAAWYVGVNLVALIQTLLISSLLLRWALPLIGVRHHAEAIAHAVGVSVPILTSYFGHKRLTFR
jgi:putative flippase GtrA